MLKSNRVRSWKPPYRETKGVKCFCGFYLLSIFKNLYICGSQHEVYFRHPLCRKQSYFLLKPRGSSLPNYDKYVNMLSTRLHPLKLHAPSQLQCRYKY